MAKRPRQHEIEEESVRAFLSALPSAWVPRRQDPDYGIDLTVEIFKDGSSTGLIFNVQLKGSDQPDLEKALRSLRLERDKVEYYASQSLPVMVVRYHAPTERLFFRWFHSYDPHVEAGAQARDQEPASIPFRFRADDEWTEESADQVVAGLRGFLRFRQAEHQLPLPLIVSPSEDVDAQLVAVELRRVLGDSQGIVSVEHRQPSQLDARVEIAAEQVRVSLADVASTTIHIDPEQKVPNWLAPNVALGFAVALTVVGQTNLGAQIATMIGEKGDLWIDPWCCMTLAGAFYRSRRLREALDVSDRLDQTDDAGASVAAYMLLSVLQAHGADLSDADRKIAFEMQENRFQRRLERADRGGAAAEAYNMAMLKKRTNDKTAAKKWFDRAAELDPSYLDRGYFNSDLAGVLFLIGDEKEAAAHYLRAVDLGITDPHVKALAADSLLFAGRYDEALAMFKQYLAQVDGGDSEDAEWRLKTMLLPTLVSNVAPEQNRQRQRAREQVEPIDFLNGPGMAIGEAEERIKAALDLDACCGWAWFCSSLLSLGAGGERAAGVQAAVLAALFNERDLNAWGNAIRLADEHDEAFVLDLIRVAYRFLGAEFEQRILEVVGAVDPAHGEILRRLLEQAVQEKSLTKARAGFTMRYPGQDGKMQEISVQPPPPGRPSAGDHKSATLDASADPALAENSTAVELFTELRRRLGDGWFEEAGSRAVEVTEKGDVVIHTGKWISFMWGKEESEGLILALDRAQRPAHISIVHKDGRFEPLGPVDLDA
jgi:tetratricopeptide (TPR) repeat protein